MNKLPTVINDLPTITDIVKTSFIEYKPKGFSDVKSLFKVVRGSAGERVKMITEIDRERIAKTKREAEGAYIPRMAEGYKKVIERKTVSITNVLSGEQYEGFTAEGLVRFATSVKEDLILKAELDMTNLFSYAQSTSYVDNGGFTIDTTTGDGLSFANTAHKLKHSSTTYSNILTGNPSLSEAALEAAVNHIKYNSFDNFGNVITIVPNTLIVTNNERMLNRARRILFSNAPEAIEGTANANSGVINTWKGRMRIKVVEMDRDANGNYDTTKSYWWAVAAITSDPSDGLQAYYVNWKAPEAYKPEIDQHKWIISFTGRMQYGIGVVSGRGIVFSFATS